jgi:hypothetical protein
MQYHYFCECGEKFPLTLPSTKSKYRPRCSKCNKKMDRDIGAEHRETVHIPGNWPMVDDALAVHPSQIKDALAHAAKGGVKIDFTPQGQPIYESARHCKEYREMRGVRANNGGYSDAQPGAYNKKYRERLEHS